ncbi:OLC1v1029632C1 [Oldenlandia corymbosa var. corymbosa]|uniref:OLC1v1029632C1 n=1 Tax=Oldenlandia corymbosa var. corymbosa TaxID=529605 RepID=A0AAV1CH93_OLDCO|nr:OLC1v1029632C1 [Oldenlandia corymbosa var. corymbosa]
MAPHSQAPSPSKGRGKVKEYFTWTPEMDKVRVDKKKILSRLKTWEKHYETLQPLLVSCNSDSAITWDYSKGRVEVHDENVWNEQLGRNLHNLLTQDRANGQGGHTLREMNAEETVEEYVNLGDPFETCEEDKIMRLMLGYQKRKEAASSSTSQGMKKKPSSSNIMCGFMKQIPENFGEFMVTERQILVATKKTTPEDILEALKVVSLDEMQTFKALDLMMDNQRLYDSLLGCQQLK